MPLIKNGNVRQGTDGSPMVAVNSTASTNDTVVSSPTTKKTAARKTAVHLTKEEYWDRKEARDIQRDKDMAWSGLAQAALSSVGVIQLNADNTEDGLVSLIVRITDKLLKARDSHNQ
jgi:hypothetical protein